MEMPKYMKIQQQIPLHQTTVVLILIFLDTQFSHINYNTLINYVLFVCGSSQHLNKKIDPIGYILFYT